MAERDIKEIIQITDKPKHYQTHSGVEVNDIIRNVLGQSALAFYIANIIKYFFRAGKKEGNSYLTDMNKIRNYCGKAKELYANGYSLMSCSIDEDTIKIIKNEAAARKDLGVYKKYHEAIAENMVEFFLTKSICKQNRRLAAIINNVEAMNNEI